ncbi:MAG: hypothetical protein IKN17_10790 [Ruminococcus sp.]|nr:hypothetical protein [Ruminococcus sp.]
MKKFISFAASLILAASLPLTALSAGQGEFYVSSASGKAGDKVKVEVGLHSSPGIISLRLAVDYDSDALTLTDCKTADFETAAVSDPGSDPFVVLWADLGAGNFKGDAVLAELTFEISGDASGEYPLSITFDEDDVFDLDFNNVDFKAANGSVTVSGGKTDSKPDSKADSKTDSKPDSKADSKPDSSAADSKPEPKPSESTPDTQPDSTPDTAPDSSQAAAPTNSTAPADSTAPAESSSPDEKESAAESKSDPADSDDRDSASSSAEAADSTSSENSGAGETASESASETSAAASSEEENSGESSAAPIVIGAVLAAAAAGTAAAIVIRKKRAE